MNFIGSRYYEVNFMLLSLIGLRNFDGQTRFGILTQIRLAICYIVLLAAIFFQLARIFTDPEINVDMSLKVCSFVFPCVLVIIRYCSTHRHINDIEKLFEQIADDWRSLKSDEEIEIVRQYANNSRIFIIGIAVCCYSTTLLLIAVQLSPILLDIVVPLNESRPKELFCLVEYFVDEKKYFRYIAAHISVSTFFEVTLFLTTESLLAVNMLHICGIFKVTSYRLEHSLDHLSSRESRDNDEVYARLVEAVNIQRRAYNYTEIAERFSTFSYSVLIVLGVCSLSINLFRWMNATNILHSRLTVQTTRLKKKQMAEFIGCGIIVLIHLFYMFITNYGGQLVINHSAAVSEKAYFTPWYQAPLRVQKYLLFISQRSRKVCTSRLGYVYIPSLEGFHSLVKASMSYFTVMYSSSNK